MSLWQAIVLGILQGTTEFLPVSSSGHLVIVPYLLGWDDPGLMLDAVLHLGTAMAVVAYFWTDLWRLFRASIEALQRRAFADPDAQLVGFIVIGTLPAAVIGFLFDDLVEQLFGMPRIAAAFLLGTAAILLLSEYLTKHTRPLGTMVWWEAMLIGISQMLAIAPGLSRSGSTIATGMLLGYRREEAARFSFLLSVPIILGVGLYQIVKILRAGMDITSVSPLIVGFLTAALVGYLSIAGLLALVRRQSLWPFAAYCALLGTLVLTGVL
ncbi:MAG: undecaprenyl-diphosphatase UppP [Anaerolineae bacterium]|nr:undecaprenyl-diphosphatase UppP [Anaerolineae bacterium]